MPDLNVPSKPIESFRKLYPTIMNQAGWWHSSHGLRFVCLCARRGSARGKKPVDAIRKASAGFAQREARRHGISTAMAVNAGAYAAIYRLAVPDLLQVVVSSKESFREFRYPRSAVHEALAALVLHFCHEGLPSQDAIERTKLVYDEMGVLRTWPTSPQDLPIAGFLQARVGTPRELVYTVESIQRALERRGYELSPMTKRISFLLFGTLLPPDPATDRYAELEGILADSGCEIHEDERDALAALCYAPQPPQVLAKQLMKCIEVVKALDPAPDETVRVGLAADLAFDTLMHLDDEGREAKGAISGRAAIVQRHFTAALINAVPLRD